MSLLVERDRVSMENKEELLDEAKRSRQSKLKERKISC
jgi:hypothetical protein